MDNLAIFKKIKIFIGFLSQSYQTLEFFFRFAKPKISRPYIVDDEFNFDKFNLQDSLTLEVDRCIRDSLDGQLMPFSIRILQGMSGQRFRALLNKLAQIQISGSYLEIGTFKGSTACSALYQNQRSAILVDNWSEFGGPKMTAFTNLSKFCQNQIFNSLSQHLKNSTRCLSTKKFFYTSTMEVTLLRSKRWPSP